MRTYDTVLVSYLNTLPFLHGLKQFRHPDFALNLRLEYPSNCSRVVLNRQAHIGLVPVASLPDLADCRVISDFCIGSCAPVATVLLLSDCPIEEIERVLLDYQSLTSVSLVRILARELWGISPEWIPAAPGYEDYIEGTTAGVVIGDRCFSLADRFACVTDLAGAWKTLTGLPFVFASWVSCVPLDRPFVDAFNQSLARGVSDIQSVVEQADASLYGAYDLHRYFTQNISFDFDTDKRRALSLFLSKLGSL